MKTFILNYHVLAMPDPQKILEKYGVTDWFQPWPGLLFFKGDQHVVYYAKLLNLDNAQGLFLMQEYDQSTTWGWMMPDVWKWTNSKK